MSNVKTLNFTYWDFFDLSFVVSNPTIIPKKGGKYTISYIDHDDEVIKASSLRMVKNGKIVNNDICIIFGLRYERLHDDEYIGIDGEIRIVIHRYNEDGFDVIETIKKSTVKWEEIR